MSLDKRQFGKTEMEVFPLGFGAGHIGLVGQDEKMVEQLLHEILDLGINLIDTARGYGVSEERIGKFLAHRRQDYILSTKVGYSVEGYVDWSKEIITAGIDRALKIMKTDYLDIVHLHSCDLEILQQGEVIESLLKAKQQGKIRAAAYSGENEALQYAVELDVFDSIECSVNIVDMNVLENQVFLAKEKQLGVIAKRPIANAPWRYKERPIGLYVEPYWDRVQTMNFQIEDYSLKELALRFIGFEPLVDNFIIGSSNIQHIRENLAILEKGVLPDRIIEKIKSEFKKHGANWRGQV